MAPIVPPGTVIDKTKSVCPHCLEMRRGIAQEKGFKITDVEIRMTGYCSKCRQNRK
ncbi:hypothetical protein ACFLTO_06165 [Chloroflexota bacterium]